MRPHVSKADRQERRPYRPRIEHIPVYSYGLLHALHRGPIAVQALYGTDNEAAVTFLISRELAERTDDMLTITRAGRSLGEIAGGPAHDS